VLLHSGHETEWQLSLERLPHLVTSDLAAAARAIIWTDRVPSTDGRET
jgi:hypothetical protein